MGIYVRSIVSVVPREVVGEEDIIKRFGKENAVKIINTTGVKEKHIAKDRSTLELAFEAGKYALEKGKVTADEIDGIVMVTQTPEYRIPPTSCMLQKKLGVPDKCFAFDIDLGCSGFPYGYIVSSSLINSHMLNRILLICGDVTSMNAAPDDQSTNPLFADGFGAVILEENENKLDSLLGHSFGTDGSGWKNLVIHTGLSHHKTKESFYESGDSLKYPEVKYPDYVYMDGGQIFTFCLRRVPAMLNDALESAKLDINDVDTYCFHQANSFLIQHLGKKIGIPENKIPFCIERYGNTSSSSVLLAACDAYGENQEEKEKKIAFLAFGVGYSWATVILNIEPQVIGTIREV